MTSVASKSREAFFKEGGSSDRDYSSGLKYSRDLGSRDRERTGLLSGDKMDGVGSGLASARGLGSASTDSDKLSGSASSALARSASAAAAAAAAGEGFVGFATLPNQVYRKAVKRGFEFTLMVVGESGLGKSTLINSLFMADLYNAEHLGPSRRLKKTVYVEPYTTLVKENGVHVKMTLVDTPGFGDAVDNSNCWTPVVDFIDSRFEDFLSAESRVNRGSSIADGRVHCVLYFIAPTGHGLKPLDIEFMRRIHDKVNIIPVIAKADTMTPEEVRDFKKTALNEIAQHKIRIYEFPDSTEEEDDPKWGRLKDRVPFSVVGANALVDKNGQKVRGRAYPWGVVEVENLEHNDFIALRNLLIRTHMQDLREVTHNVLYENYRYAKLSGIAQESKFKTTDGKDPMTQMETEKREHEAKMRKMEAEMEQVFEMKVKEKKQKLKESEADLQRRAEQMSKQLSQQEQELEQKRAAFERERQLWEQGNHDNERRRSLDGSPSNDNYSSTKEKSKTEKRKGLFK